MKKWLVSFLWTASMVAVVLTGGCNLGNEPAPDTGIQSPGNDLVISEVFKISPDKYYAFCWIELFNPTEREMYWIDTKLEFYDSLMNRLPDSLVSPAYDTAVVQNQLVLQMIAKRSFFDQQNNDYITGVDTGVVYYSTGGGEDNIIQPGFFAVLTNNTNRLDTRGYPGPSHNVVYEFDRVVVLDSAIGPNQRFRLAYWDLLDRGEIQLKRYISKFFLHSGLVFVDSVTVDVVRYGNYLPNPDPFPGNISMGDIPEDYSLARYASYFKTGNTSDAFYMSPNPIPGWYNQRKKK